MNNEMPVVWSYWCHEPLRHLRRMSNDGSSIFSLGDWAKDWYNHIHSEEMLKKAAEVGINVIYTHFYKGFGLETEREEMENTRLLCQRAAKYGIKVLGYCQLGSMNYETLMDEIPGLEEIAIRGENGQPLDWYGEYYRWIPCFNKRIWIDYIKKVITYGLEHVGLSGFHFDNSYNYACFCDDCTKAFRNYLTAHVKDPEEIGFRHFRNVRIPKHSADPESHDPLYLHWLQYKIDLSANVRNEIFDHVKNIKQDAIVLHNPGFPHWGPDFTRRGFDPARSNPDNCDFIFAEGSPHITFADGKIESCVDAFKFGERFGYKVFDTSWERNTENKYVWPTTECSIARAIAQSMVYGGICGAPYTVRSIKNGHQNVLEDTPLAAYMEKYFHYFKENYDFYNKPSENNIKLLYVTESCLASPNHGINLMRACSRELVTAGFPYSIITKEDLQCLSAGQIVIVPELRYADEDTMTLLKETGARGVKLLVLGTVGKFHCNGKERSRQHWIHTMGKENGFYRVSDTITETECARSSTGRSLEFGEDGTNLSAADCFIPLLRKLNTGHEILRDQEGILLETKKLSDTEIILHLINAGNEPVNQVTVTTQFSIHSLGKYVSPDGVTVALADNRTIQVFCLQSVVSIIIRKK